MFIDDERRILPVWATMFKVKTLISIFYQQHDQGQAWGLQSPANYFIRIAFSVLTADTERSMTTRAILLLEAPAIVPAQESPTESDRWRHE